MVARMTSRTRALAAVFVAASALVFIVAVLVAPPAAARPPRPPWRPRPTLRTPTMFSEYPSPRTTPKERPPSKSANRENQPGEEKSLSPKTTAVNHHRRNPSSGFPFIHDRPQHRLHHPRHPFKFGGRPRPDSPHLHPPRRHPLRGSSCSVGNSRRCASRTRPPGCAPMGQHHRRMANIITGVLITSQPPPNRGTP